MPKTSILRPYLAAAIVNLTCLCLGMIIGWMSPAAPVLQSNPPPLGGDRAITDEEISWLGSLQFLGGITGVFFYGKVAEKFGRKIAGYSIALPILIGWSLVFIAKSPIWLIAGRFIMGFGGTSVLVLAPLYVSEISEDSYRGTLGSFVMLFLNLGVVISYFSGSILSLPHLTLFCLSVPIVFLISYYFLPESPVYLCIKGKKKEAKVSLLWLRSGNQELVDRELSVLEKLVSSSKTSVPISRLFENKGTIKAMIISLALFFFQQFCGIMMLLTYTSIILIKSEIEFSPHTATTIIGLLQFLASWASSFIIDRINRKTLLIISNLGMAVALFIIGLFFYFQKYSEDNILPNWTPFVFMCIHVVVYSTSASLPYVITSETLIPDVRPLAFSVTIFWGTAMTFTSVKIFTFLVDNFYMHGNFWFFGAGCILATAFTIIYIPETRGKSLIEIIKILNGQTFASVPTITKPEYTEIPITEQKEES